MRINILIMNNIVLMWGVLTFNGDPRKRMAVIAFITMMLAYSARKNIAKGPAAYSTLNPETSSDSPSVKSNGARFVSASVEIYHIMVRGHVVIINHIFSCVINMFFKVKEPLISIIERRIIANVTS